ncbi:MAG TPA: tetratricopeptide repeat protein [Bryobacteraceae bacterium]|nr:tetratricopeptide repeat protein [Bryobacteraceae bacterium]
MRWVFLLLAALEVLSAQGQFERAEQLYQRTDYQASLSLLSEKEQPSDADYGLMGRDYFMLGEYKKATDVFLKAFAMDPRNSEYAHWLGRAFGRRAETSGPFTAPLWASKARQYFEEAVALDGNNGEALNDLFDYYLEAPGFLGGGYNKAEAVAKRIAEHNQAEGYFAQAQLADKRKQYDTAADQLRRAMDLAPHQVGRVLDLARYLARHGRIPESEAAFDRAERLAPHDPRVWFVRARVYVEQKRNLAKAKQLLLQYLESDLTPDDAPREQAEKLLKEASGA